jgi:ABC-type multidrug transport system fused ATPase/permease subunit
MFLSLESQDFNCNQGGLTLSVFFKLLGLMPSSIRNRVFFVLIISILASVLEIVGLASVGPFIQFVSTKSAPDFLQSFNFFSEFSDVNKTLLLGGVSLCLILLSGLFSIMSMVVIYKYAFKVGEYVSSVIIDYLLSISPAIASRYEPSIVIRDVTQDANLRIVHLVFVSGVMLISKSFVAIFIIVALLFINPIASLSVAAFLSIIYTFIYIFVRSKMNTFGEVISARSQKLISVINDCISTVREIYIWGLAEKISKDFKLHLSEHNSAQFNFNWLSQSPKIIIETISFSILVVTCVFISVNYSNLDHIIAQFTLFILAGYKLLPAMQQIFWSVSSLKVNKSAFDNIEKYFNHESTISSPDIDIAVELDVPSSSNLVPKYKNSLIQLKDVSVVFDNAKVALNHISLNIDPGEKVAFIGSSGGGKTTCLNVLLGLQNISDGDLVVGDVSIVNNFDAALDWSRSCSLVSQDVYLLNDTLENNILFFSEEQVDYNRLKLAVDVSHSNFCKLDFNLGSRGTSLSGGQKQRVGIARSLYKNFELLALDEATSSLDNEIEESILIDMFSNFPDKSIVMIIHRLHILKHFDKIVVFDNGSIECIGTLDFIRDNSSVYKRLMV